MNGEPKEDVVEAFYGEPASDALLERIRSGTANGQASDAELEARFVAALRVFFKREN